MSFASDKAKSAPANWSTDQEIALMLGIAIAANRPEAAKRYSSELSETADLILWMADHGSSFLLNYGEDDHLWECSWITSGKRYTGTAGQAPLAICRSALMARAAHTE